MSLRVPGTFREAEEEVQAKKIKAPRLHHMDWLRAISIGFAVYLHCWNIVLPEIPVITVDNVALPPFGPNSTEYAVARQDQADWKYTDYSWRFIMVGRQLIIPLLFWISGASMGFGKGSLVASGSRIGLITAVGLAANALLFYGL